ncbi:hypothetical protein HY26_04215 [Hyphomonas sp. GM-8P]|nr:hypothetical protein HY26_04215 [Hyphomonas sp. GM-8P]
MASRSKLSEDFPDFFNYGCGGLVVGSDFAFFAPKNDQITKKIFQRNEV